MKRRNILLLTFLLSMLCLISTVWAQTITVEIDGKELNCRKSPMIVHDRVLVPLRDVMTPLGYEVIWNHQQRSIQAKKNQTTIQLTMDANYATVNGGHMVLDAPPIIIDDIAMIPLRFVADHSGATVQWDSNTHTVHIQQNTLPKQKQTADSVVYIQTNKLMGSGVILSADGLIATNYHVLEHASTAQIIFDDGEVYYGEIRVVGLDPQADIAIIRIKKSGLHPVSRADSIQINEPVKTITSGGGKRNTTTQGKITKFDDDIISMTAPIQHGSSGGGLFNANGQILGICSSYSQDQYFAIPIKKVLNVPKNMNMPLSHMKNYVYQPGAPRNIHYTKKDGYSYLSWEPVYDVDYYHVLLSKTPDGPFVKMTNRTLQNDHWYWNFPHAFGVSMPDTDTFYLKIASVKDGVICGISPMITVS